MERKYVKIIKKSIENKIEERGAYYNHIILEFIRSGILTISFISVENTVEKATV